MGANHISDKMFEKVSGDKVANNITQDAKEAGKKVVADVVKRFVDKGFDPKEITPLVKKGVKEATE